MIWFGTIIHDNRISDKNASIGVGQNMERLLRILLIKK